MAIPNTSAGMDRRVEPRDEVLFRTRGVTEGEAVLAVTVVNMSARGFMARCETELGPDERIRIQLPAVGTVTAIVRWSLGGRIGCELDQPIRLADYFAVLSAMRRSDRAA